MASTEVATICAVCFFVLRSLFARGDVPWVQLGPAICFVVLWFIFQVSFLRKTDRGATIWTSLRSWAI
eukprot:symbB.v1.2.038013.t1/scaffold5779.1/size23665/2